MLPPSIKRTQLIQQEKRGKHGASLSTSAPGQASRLLSPRLLAAQETIALWSKRGAPGLEGVGGPAETTEWPEALPGAKDL